METNPTTTSSAPADSKIYFQWQNPHLLNTIYPARKRKLIEFLLVYDEVEVVEINKRKAIDEIKGEYDQLPERLPDVVDQGSLDNEENKKELALGQNYTDQYNRLMGTRVDTSKELNPREAFQVTKAVSLFQMRQQFENYRDLDHTALLNKVVERFHKSPGVFPEWLIYMVIHFSGMRYQSAHGCYRDPLDLLRVLEVDTEGLSDEMAVEKLKEYKHAQEKVNKPIPDWAWKDIVRYTPLRNETEEDDWEAKGSKELSSEEAKRWDQILKNWEPENTLLFNNLTLWRFKHYESLALNVTSAVCNEVGEHIQHMRGLSTSPGLAMKPDWYNKQKTEGAFFKHQDREDDFLPGAAIFWLEWYDSTPGAHEVVTALTGIDLPEKLCAGKVNTGALKYREEWSCWKNNNRFFRTINIKPSQDDKEQIKSLKKGTEVNKKQINLLANKLRRPDKLKKGEKTSIEREIKSLSSKIDRNDQKIAQINQKSGKRIQYLRWVHEAIVVSLENMINGRQVITFETEPGTMGINLRPNQNLQGREQGVFIGYAPAKELPKEKDQKLVEMLRWNKILQQPGAPKRVRHKEALEKIQSIPTDETSMDEHLMVIQPAGIKLKKGILKRGTHLLAVRQEKDGEISFRVTRCEALPEATGSILTKADLTPVTSGIWVESKEKTSGKVISAWNKKNFPLFKNAVPKMKLVPGEPFLVSATHQFNPKTDQGGQIQGDGKGLWYLIIQHPDLTEAAGLYVNAGQVSRLSAPETWEDIQSKLQAGIKPGSESKTGNQEEEILSDTEELIMVNSVSGSQIDDQLLLGRGSMVLGKPILKGGETFYLITQSEEFPEAVGKKIKAADVISVKTCLIAKLTKPSNALFVTKFNKKGKPIFEGLAPKVNLAAEVAFVVSASHQINPSDQGGLVQGDGKRNCYLVLAYPGQPEAAGLYVEASNLTIISGTSTWEDAMSQTRPEAEADTSVENVENQDFKPA